MISTSHADDDANIPIVGDHGVIVASTPVGTVGQVRLSFTRATSPRGDTLLYTVYYSKQSAGIVMYSFCGLERAIKASQSFTFIEPKAERTITGLIPDEVYIFNVMVTTQDEPSSRAVYSIVYQASSNSPAPESSSSSVGWLLGIGGAALLIAVACIVSLALRNRKLSKELEVEMHDIPKAAVRKAVRGPETSSSAHDDESKEPKPTKSYHPLLTDDAADSETYAPPEFDAATAL